MESLEKQISKKPKNKKITFPESYEENIEYYCPRCNKYLTSEYEGNFVDRCYNCKQEIDWSEE